jgi:hypothetical protein
MWNIDRSYIMSRTRKQIIKIHHFNSSSIVCQTRWEDNATKIRFLSWEIVMSRASVFRNISIATCVCRNSIAKFCLQKYLYLQLFSLGIVMQRTSLCFTILDLGTRWRWVIGFTPFYPQGRSFLGSWVGPRVGVELIEKRKCSFPCLK